MDLRFTLMLIAAALIGGAAVLWLSPQQQVSASAPALPGAPSMHAVLAVSWEPAFCEGARSKPECRSQSDTRFDADHFVLHGLWPDDDYCGVSSGHESADRDGRWFDLPAVELSGATRAALASAMPGMQSGLERHEWIKHGTCSETSAEIFYGRAMALLAGVNGSAVRTLFAGRLGGEVSAAEIGAAFDTAFGTGAGDRVDVRCARDGERTLITELQIELSGDVMGSGSLRQLMAGAPLVDVGCDGGVVDRVGWQ